MSKAKPESPSCKKGDGDKAGGTVKECPRGELIVHVKDADGKPVKDVYVNAGRWGTKKTGNDGIADFGKVDAGTDKVIAKKPGHAPKKNDPEGEDSKEGVTVTDGSKTTVELVQHPICANVAFFEGSKSSRSTYYGFDHKTNLVATPGTGEYWLPTPPRGSLSMPGSKLTRDGSRWVSVANGGTSEVEIEFAFTGAECIPCISNSNYEVVPADIAEVVTKSITSKKAKFEIKGKAEGEASLKVICDGNVVGWFHIWCKNEATIKIDVINLITNRASATSYNLASLATTIGEIFMQAALKVDVASLGDVDLTANAPLAAIESSDYTAAGGRFQSSSGVLSALHTAADAILAARTVAPLPRAGAYRIYRYVPTAGAQWAGMVINIGSSPAFSYMVDSAAARNSIAHEFGHCLGLKHPSDGSGSTQFAVHNVATVNQAVPLYAATNTEPASVAGSAAGNVMKNDPTNLMGYWPDKANRKPIRYHQWKICSRA